VTTSVIALFTAHYLIMADPEDGDDLFADLYVFYFALKIE
jgi:hypothetical protein